MNVEFTAIQIDEALNQCACETLENLAFTEILPLDATTLRMNPDQCLGARISLGPVGSLDLILEKGFLAEVGGTLFSVGPEGLEAEALPDTLHEILNIIAGRFLEKLFQNHSDFEMGLPIEHFDPDEWNALPTRRIYANEGKIALAIGLGPTTG